MSTVDVEPAPRSTRRERAHARKRRTRRTVVIVVVIAAVLVTPALAAGGWFWYQLDPPGEPGGRVAVTVQDGWGVRRIGDELVRRGVIGSALAFELYAQVEGSSTIRSGPYELRKDLGVREALRTLAGAPRGTPQIGVLPGTTLAQVADNVAEIRRFSRAGFLDVATSGGVRSRYEPAGVTSLEGLLRPESYPVGATETETTLTRAMVAAFDARADSLDLDAAARRVGVRPYDVIIVASLIQREAKLDSDRPLIAAVVYNRLRAAMPLQIDATQQYARTTGLAGYDTYRIPALPPSPISNISTASLRAAMAPAAVAYRYYVLSDANGKHAFSETYEQHLQNVAEARRKGLLG